MDEALKPIRMHLPDVCCSSHKLTNINTVTAPTLYSNSMKLLPFLRRSKEMPAVPETCSSIAPEQRPRGLAKWEGRLEPQHEQELEILRQYSQQNTRRAERLIQRAHSYDLQSDEEDDDSELLEEERQEKEDDDYDALSYCSYDDDEEFDEILNNPCSPRWVADHAAASIQQFRSVAQAAAVATYAP
jgi:hypothetical protein